MSRAPSGRALRYLTRLCHRTIDNSSRATSTNSTVVTSRSISTCRHRSPAPSSQRLSSSSISTSSSPLIKKRNFGNTLVFNAESIKPGRQDPDPSNRASPKLPDITTYYTLFPSTLPNGPPGPPQSDPKIQTSTTPTGTDTSRIGQDQIQNDNFAKAEGQISQVEVENKLNEAPHYEDPTSRFHIDLKNLRKEFLKLQSTHHPDKYPTSTPAHQKALALSSLINNAYKTLSDPLLRAQYLLQLQYGIDVTSEDNAAHPTDQDTLMEVMDAQEKIEEAQTQSQVDGLKEENLKRIEDVVTKIGEAFDRGDQDVAKKETVRLKYWRSLQQGLDDWEPGKEVRLIH